MGKEKKGREWIAFLRGCVVSLLVYLVGILLLTLFVIKGILPEHSVIWLIAGLGFVAAKIGSGTTAKRSSLPSVPTGLLAASLFILVLALLGGLGWPEALRSSRSAICGISVLLGGFIAGISGTGRRQRRKKRRIRTGMK